MQNHHLAHLAFAKELLGNDLDMNALGINLRQVITPDMLHDFCAHLLVEEKFHTEYKEFKRHFRNYINSKPKNYGAKANIGTDKIGRIERDKLSEYLNRRNSDTP